MKATYEIITGDQAPENQRQFYAWCCEEWGKIDPQPLELVISPLLAVNHEVLLGGLAFRWFPRPGSTTNGLWIDAVVVDPKQRRSGLASQLIRQAEQTAYQLGESALYVFTHLPGLYLKLEWTLVDQPSDNAWVLQKTLKLKKE